MLWDICKNQSIVWLKAINLEEDLFSIFFYLLYYQLDTFLILDFTCRFSALSLYCFFLALLFNFPYFS